MSLTSYCPRKEVVRRGRNGSRSSWGKRLAGLPCWVYGHGRTECHWEQCHIFNLEVGWKMLSLFTVPQYIDTQHTQILGYKENA